jgi:hypothetical protein
LWDLSKSSINRARVMSEGSVRVLYLSLISNIQEEGMKAVTQPHLDRRLSRSEAGWSVGGRSATGLAMQDMEWGDPCGFARGNQRPPHPHECAALRSRSMGIDQMPWTPPSVPRVIAVKDPESIE